MIHDQLIFSGRLRGVRILLIWVLCTPLFVLSAVAQRASVVAQHGDLLRTGWNKQETALTVGNVRPGSFGKAYSVDVDDQIYAQPLVINRVSIGGGQHGVVYVATVNNTVYAIDADKSLVYWSKNYSPAGQRPPRNTDMTGACGGGYRDFSGNIGIVGTPVIDSLSQTMYFVARSTNGSQFFQYLHAVSLSNGAERAGSPTLITATYAGNAWGSVNNVITFDPQRQNQRCGLLLLNGVVYISYASHCDWGPYHGWILGYDAQTLAQKVVYNTTPDGYNGGIWMSAAAPAADEAGNIYVAVGNGSIGVGSNISNLRNRSESALRLTPSGNTLTVSSFFTPSNYQDLENADLDFGSSQMLLLPNTNLVVTGCKDGNIYLMNRDNLGGYNPTNQVVQTIGLGSGKGLRSSFAYYGGAKEFFYTWSENAALKAFPFNRSTGKFDEGGVIIGSAQGPTGASGTLMAVSSNGTVPGTGVLWTSHAAFGDANQSVRPGILRAFDANDVTKELWNSKQNAADDIGSFAKFVCPTVANGKVYMATFSNKLVVYGLTGATPPPPAACNATTNVALNKPAVASSYEDATRYPAAAAFDNSTGTRWASAQGIDPQWIYVDLQARYDLCQVSLNWETALGRDFQLQISDDAQTWTTVQTVTGNTALSNTISLQGTGRYLRLYGTARGTPYGYSLFDFQVFGTAAAASSCVAPANLAVASQSRTGATLTWDAVPGAGSYNVAYKSVAAAAYTTVAVTTNRLPLTALSCGTDYLFKVQATCSATTASAFSGDKAFSTLICDPNCGILPTRWYTQDVGAVGIPGQACFSNGVFRLQGSGADIWDTADGFRMAYKTFSGDGQITARIDSLDGVNVWNKAGLMFRESLDANSRHALMALTSGSGAAFQYRQTTGGTSLSTEIPGIQAPYYLKLIKRGTRYTGYVSPDSVAWQKLGTTVDLGFGSGPIVAGIVLTSHSNMQLSKAVFSHVPIVFSADTTVNSIVTTVYEAENAVLSGVQVDNLWPGYTGTGFGDYINPNDDYVEWIVNVPTAGSYQLGFRYALGRELDRPLQIMVNGSVVNSALSFPNTSTWTNWQVVRTTAALTAGSNKVRATATGRSGANLDHLEVSATPNVTPRALSLHKEMLENTVAAASQPIALYPNPATRSVTVTLPAGQADEITVRDVSGRSIWHSDRISGKSQVVIALGAWPAGLYTVHVRNQQHVYVKRLVKLPE